MLSNESWFDVPGIDYAKFTMGYDVSGNDGSTLMPPVLISRVSCSRIWPMVWCWVIWEYGSTVGDNPSFQLRYGVEFPEKPFELESKRVQELDRQPVDLS